MESTWLQPHKVITKNITLNSSLQCLIMTCNLQANECITLCHLRIYLKISQSCKQFIIY